MYKNILVPIDVSHQERHEVAMDMARVLADPQGAKITAISVVEPIPAYVGISGMIPEFDSQVKATVRESLESFADSTEDEEDQNRLSDLKSRLAQRLAKKRAVIKTVVAPVTLVLILAAFSVVLAVADVEEK